MRKRGRSIFEDKTLLAAILVLIVTSFSIGSIFFSAYSVGGYSSVISEWDRVDWNGHSVDYYGTSITFDGNDVTFPYNLNPLAGTVYAIDWTKYSANIDQPKFDHNLDYHDWWANETVSEMNPEGVAEHYEWSIDEYRMMVTFQSHGHYGLEACNGAEFWLELTNNFQSVFDALGAEKAASYVIGAYVYNYTWGPASAGWHIINPTQGNYELYYLEGDTVSPPAAFAKGSYLDFEALESYSHVGLRFQFVDFGTAFLGSDCTVNIEVALNVLTIGQFDYVLTYESGGDNSDAPIGNLGILDGIGAALGAGLSALGDTVGDLLQDAALPIMMLVAVIGMSMVIIIVVKFGNTRKGKR